MIPSHLLQAYATYFKHACYMPYPLINYIKKTQVFKFILTQCVMYLYMYIYIYIFTVKYLKRNVQQITQNTIIYNKYILVRACVYGFRSCHELLYRVQLTYQEPAHR